MQYEDRMSQTTHNACRRRLILRMFAIADGVRYDVAFSMTIVIFHCLCFTLKHEKEVSSLSMQVMIDVVHVIVFVAVVPVVVELRNDRCDTNI